MNAELVDDIQNEHNLSNNIDNREECDRLRKQIYDYKYNRDPEGTKWLTYYKQTFPILQNGTRLDDIDNPTIISQICDQYAEKNTGGYIQVNNNSGNGSFAGSSSTCGDLFMEEED